MKRTALILASAAAFDLGVMVVAAQAQQQGDIPPTRPTHGSPMSGPIYGLAVQDPTGTGGCTPGSPLPGGTANPCAPAAITDQAAQGNLTAVMPTAGGERPTGHKTDNFIYIKLDRVNTLQACRTRQGEVVRHQGAQQCRLPAAVPSQGNPRPGASPPRN